jgi:hypothetical protein
MEIVKFIFGLLSFFVKELQNIKNKVNKNKKITQKQKNKIIASYNRIYLVFFLFTIIFSSVVIINYKKIQTEIIHLKHELRLLPKVRTLIANFKIKQLKTTAGGILFIVPDKKDIFSSKMQVIDILVYSKMQEMPVSYINNLQLFSLTILENDNTISDYFTDAVEIHNEQCRVLKIHCYKLLLTKAGQEIFPHFNYMIACPYHNHIISLFYDYVVSYNDAIKEAGFLCNILNTNY